MEEDDIELSPSERSFVVYRVGEVVIVTPTYPNASNLLAQRDAGF